MSKPVTRRKGFTLVELLVVIGIIALLISILLPSLNRAREQANKVKCAANLTSIYKSMYLYSNDNKGNFPRTLANPTNATTNTNAAIGTYDSTNNGSTSVDPFSSGGQQNDVVQSIFLIIRTQDITSEVFGCPSANAEKDPYGTGAGAAAVNKLSFSKKENLNYSFSNPFPGKQAIDGGYKWNNSLSSEFCMAGDMNPGVTAPNYDVTAPKDSNSASSVMKKANSPNHNGAGENLMYGDGHVQFESNPFNGAKRDCVYTNSPNDTTPSSQTEPKASNASNIPGWGQDSVLIPTVNW